MSAGAGAAVPRDRSIVDNPTPRQRGDAVGAFVNVQASSTPCVLFSPACLGTEAQVVAALSKCLLLQHDDAEVDKDRVGFGRYKKPRDPAYIWNETDPTTEILRLANGARLLLGGIECGIQPTVAGAASPPGLRPCVVDARGDIGSQNVRGWVSESHAEHTAKGVKHAFFETNWLMKNGGDEELKLIHLFDFLERVCGWLADGHDVHIHCISPLFPSEGLILVVMPNVITKWTHSQIRAFWGGDRRNASELNTLSPRVSKGICLSSRT